MGSLVKTGEASEALYYAELLKNSQLNTLTSSKNGKTISVKQIQNSLAADEALIYYVGTGTLDNTAFFNFLITKEKVSGGFFDLSKPVAELFQFLPEHIAEIEKKLAAKELRTARNTSRPPYGPDYMAQSGDMRIYFDLYRSYLHPETEIKKYIDPKIFKLFSNQLWEYLIPGVKYMEGKTKLIICPAGDLSFIPFEVVRNSNTGKLLVEDYEIIYTPSATVLVKQRAEPKKVFKKNILAFGDAKYSLRKDSSFPVKSIEDVKRMQLAVHNSISKNENLDYAFAGMQGEEPMKYLIGTKNEVDAIKLLVPKTDVRMDAMMTENELKKLSKSGALNDYKVIHLASHASVHPYIFELSSIAMSVNESPVDGEDGMITVDEMKELDMNPELVMLSACQTGLGRLTTGDTVQGLNNSLLLAGADATLTSLWSVNDYATSIFVKEFYDRVFNDNVPYKTAVTQVKREFLAGKFGEELKHPEYWAPFIYYGK
jgi:CHAT domain-containing protein